MGNDTVAELIESLSGLPAGAQVGAVWDGASRSSVDAAWLAQSGRVLLGASDEPVYYDDDRSAGATAQSDNSYLRVGEMLGIPMRSDEDDE